MQLSIKDHQDQQTKNEGGEGGAHNTKYAQTLVYPTVLVNSRLYAQPDADTDHGQHCPQSEVNRIREASFDKITDWHGR